MFIDRFSVTERSDLSNFTVENTEGKLNAAHLNICIVTEEIYGPIRNGGIATTYFYLACMLEEEGHHVSVLYLRGSHSEIGDIAQWIAFYKERNISLIALEDSTYTFDQIDNPRLRKYSAAYHWLLRNNKFDLIHSSEWRGGLYYALQHKQLGGAFSSTIFAIKSSSPWIWNRHYMNDLVGRMDEITFMHGEKTCIELADIVIGGSAHLLSFMENQGYRIDPRKAFVQPNILDFSHLKIVDQRGNPQPGDVIHTKDWVFFGRLESRKGLHLFCDAIDELHLRGKHPEKITFLGKEGFGFPSYQGVGACEYIEARSKDWPCEIVILNDKQQNEAIQYLVEENRLAVMPSIIENSTMAAYETLSFSIPFIATQVGGTPELVDAGDWDRVLCKANARDLARQLERCHDEGALVANCTFDLARNIETWKNFHQWLAVETGANGADRALEKITGRVPAPKYTAGISVCLLANHQSSTENILGQIQHLSSQTTTSVEVLVGVVGPKPRSTQQKLMSALQDKHASVKVLVAESSGTDLGACLNYLSETADYEWLVFSRTWNSQLSAATIQTLINSDPNTRFKAVSWAIQETASGKGHTRLPMAENSALYIHDPFILGGPDFALKKSHWSAGNLFTEGAGFEYPEQEYLYGLSQQGVLCALPSTLTTVANHYSMENFIPYYLRRRMIEDVPFGLKALLISKKLDPGLSEHGLSLGQFYIRLPTVKKAVSWIKRRMKGTGEFQD